MSRSSEQRSTFLRFLDAFLHEDNIKWMLGAGVCILLGSSLRLVTMHWNECTPVWKYLILLGYTGTVFPLGELSYHRLGLRKTGTVLMALTVLLIPLSFLALHRVRPGEVTSTMDFVLNTGLSGLLAINLLWGAFAAERIFRHFLRQTQPTFLIAYLVLCVAGAVVPGLPVTWAPILSIVLWGAFTAGTVKVNRHVFWLTEEHRLPRVFGFFPVLLLGAQFATVIGFGLGSHLTLAWTGFLCTLVALPILLTADTVARVFEQRTGGIVRPFPWSISGPLMFGTTLCAIGVVLSLAGFPASVAAVPTAGLATFMLAVIAHRTRIKGFVWGMVFCILVTYQTSPVFFKGLVLQLRDQTASALNESRLPYAFYGLTYAPLVVLFSLIASYLQRRGSVLYAVPLRITASILPWLLFGLAFAHPSAILPVVLLLSPVFSGQAALFRQRLFLIPAAFAWLAAAYGTPAFCDRVLDCPMSDGAALLVWTTAAALLFVPGFILDRWSRSLDLATSFPTLSSLSGNLCQLISLVATIAASLIWIERQDRQSTALQFEIANVLSALMALLLISHSLRWVKHRLSEWTIGFCTYLVFRSIAFQYDDVIGPASTFCGLFLAQWLCSYGLKRWPAGRITRAFARPLAHVSFGGMSLLFGFFLLNWIAGHFVPVYPSWTTSLVVVIWGLDAARRLRNSHVATIAWIGVFAFSTSAFQDWYGDARSAPWLMATWVTIAFILLLSRHAMTRLFGLNEHATDEAVAATAHPNRWNALRPGFEALLSPLDFILPTLFTGIAFANLFFLGWPHRIAGILALVGVYVLRRNRTWPNAIILLWPLLNWQILAIFLTACLPISRPILWLTRSDLDLCGLPLAALAGLGVWCFEWKPLRDRIRFSDVVGAHQTLLLGTVLWIFWNAWFRHSTGYWATIDLVCGIVAWLALVAALLAKGIREQQHEHIWHALATLFVAFSYLTIAGAWDLASPVMPYVCLIAGMSFRTIGLALRNLPRYGIVSTPFRQTGFWLPLAVIPFSLWKHVLDPVPAWAGLNSLPLLAAAMFYFWRGLERRHMGSAVISAVVLNLAIALVWKELQWSDPQLFLMPIGISVLALTELLNREVPAQYHDRLRLASALLILVSPTFHIVSGSWLHILTLMIASVAVALIAIGFRVRILLCTSSAFLLADLAALVARGSMDQPNLLWIVGVGVGVSVIALGAVCENHRETVLGRLRGLAAELELWR